VIYIVLPAFNEKKNLIQVFKKINKLKVKSKVTVILVDDCSNDGTHLLKNSKNNFKLIYIKNTINLGLSLTLKKWL
jgi:glycosyltransferase involved in cell wall biosynthesis